MSVQTASQPPLGNKLNKTKLLSKMNSAWSLQHIMRRVQSFTAVEDTNKAHLPDDNMASKQTQKPSKHGRGPVDVADETLLENQRVAVNTYKRPHRTVIEQQKSTINRTIMEETQEMLDGSKVSQSRKATRSLLGEKRRIRSQLVQSIMRCQKTNQAAHTSLSQMSLRRPTTQSNDFSQIHTISSFTDDVRPVAANKEAGESYEHQRRKGDVENTEKRSSRKKKCVDVNDDKLPTSYCHHSARRQCRFRSSAINIRNVLTQRARRREYKSEVSSSISKDLVGNPQRSRKDLIDDLMNNMSIADRGHRPESKGGQEEKVIRQRNGDKRRLVTIQTAGEKQDHKDSETDEGEDWPDENFMLPPPLASAGETALADTALQLIRKKLKNWKGMLAERKQRAQDSNQWLEYVQQQLKNETMNEAIRQNKQLSSDIEKLRHDVHREKQQRQMLQRRCRDLEEKLEQLHMGGHSTDVSTNTTAAVVAATPQRQPNAVSSYSSDVQQQMLNALRCQHKLLLHIASQYDHTMQHDHIN